MEEKQENNEILVNVPNRKKIIIIVVSIVAILICISIIIGVCSSNKKNPSGLIGDTVENGDGVTFTINKVENTQKIGSGYLSETTNNNFIIITLTVQNLSEKTITMFGSCINLYNEKGSKIEEYSSILIDYIISADLNPGTSKTFQVAFETATTTKEETYIAKIGYSLYTSNENRVHITLKTH